LKKRLGLWIRRGLGFLVIVALLVLATGAIYQWVASSTPRISVSLARSMFRWVPRRGFWPWPKGVPPPLLAFDPSGTVRLHARFARLKRSALTCKLPSDRSISQLWLSVTGDRIRSSHSSHEQPMPSMSACGENCRRT
jgi:hypothetical protein